MSKEDNRQQFINFLKKQNCYEQYKNNTSSFINVFDYIMKIDAENWINGIFGYQLTPEGIEYWVGMDILWNSKFR